MHSAYFLGNVGACQVIKHITEVITEVIFYIMISTSSSCWAYTRQPDSCERVKLWWNENVQNSSLDWSAYWTYAQSLLHMHRNCYKSTYGLKLTINLSYYTSFAFLSSHKYISVLTGDRNYPPHCPGQLSVISDTRWRQNSTDGGTQVDSLKIWLLQCYTSVKFTNEDGWLRRRGLVYVLVSRSTKLLDVGPG